ncbi:hypothetical protein D3C72_2023210 [compost metagenome]
MPVLLGGWIIFLTDPLNIHSFLDNWKDTEISVPKFAIQVIDCDMEFDSIIGRELNAGRSIVVDPMFEASGQLMRGIEIREIGGA